MACNCEYLYTAHFKVRAHKHTCIPVIQRPCRKWAWILIFIMVCGRNLPIICGAMNSVANMHLEVNKKLFILSGACYQTTAAWLQTDMPSWQGKTTSKSPRCVDSERENMCTPHWKKRLYARSSIPDQISRHNLIFAEEGRVKLTHLFECYTAELFTDQVMQFCLDIDCDRNLKAFL